MSDKKCLETIQNLINLVSTETNEEDKKLSILTQIDVIINNSTIEDASVEDPKDTGTVNNLENQENQENTKKIKMDGGGKKALTKYNIFMRSELEKLKLKKPKADYKTRFKEAVNNWKKSNKQ
jgi:hypothetical protein